MGVSQATKQLSSKVPPNGAMRSLTKKKKKKEREGQEPRNKSKQSSGSIERLSIADRVTE